MAFDINDTRTLLEVVDRSIKPTTALVDTFFPNAATYITEMVDIEYRKGSQRMAPFVVPRSRGVNMERENSVVRSYKAPLMKPKRNITDSDIQRRGFGETIYSTKSPEMRAQELRAKDLSDLIDSCVRRQEWMAAQLLIAGGYDIEGYADDGKTVLVDKLTFPGFENIVTISGSGLTWDAETAKIYDDLNDVSKMIRRGSGLVPTVAVCSSNVVEYLLKNKQIRDFLLVSNNNNLSILSLQPRLVRPELMRVGFISSMNLEIYAYDGGYTDENDAFHTYIPDDHVVIGVPGRGKRLFGAVTQLEGDRQYHTYEGMYVPKYTADVDNDVTSLAVSSRCVICPESVDDWAVLKVK